MSTKFSK